MLRRFNHYTVGDAQIGAGGHSMTLDVTLSYKKPRFTISHRRLKKKFQAISLRFAVEPNDDITRREMASAIVEVTKKYERK